MKIAITSQGQTLDSTIDPHFGRCPYLLLVETDDMNFEAVENPYASQSGGVGSRLAALIAGRGVKRVLTGTVGPNAKQALDAVNIETVLDCSGTAQQAIDTVKTGQLPTDEKVPTNPASTIATETSVGPGSGGRGFGHRHHGGGQGGGRGQGKGQGRGKGKGQGRGRQR